MSDRKPVLSLITGTRNRPDGIARFLESVHTHTTSPYEVLVGDASDEPATIDSAGGRVRVVREDPPLGYAAGYNCLFAQARGDIVVLLNDDLELLPHWHGKLESRFRRNKNLGLLSLPNFEPQTDFTFFLRYDDLPLANFAAIRRTVGEQVGWYDEAFPFYGPDTDLALKVYHTKWLVLPLLQRVLVHRKPESEERSNNEASIAEADARIHAKWAPHLTAMRKRWREQMADAYDGLVRSWHPDYQTAMLILPESF